MTLRPFVTHAGLGLAASLLPASVALAHSGHSAPAVHAHTGSPSLLVVLAITALGIAATAGLARRVVRYRRLRRQR